MWKMGREIKGSLDLNLKQKQAQLLSFEQQQSLTILQKDREEISELLMDIAQGNPLMIVEESRDMLPIDTVKLSDVLSVLGSHYDAFDLEVTRYRHEDAHQTMINQLPDTSRQSIKTFLMDQIMCYRHTRIRDLMLKLVDELDQQGFISKSHDELRANLSCNQIELLDAITLFQQLEPAGIGASSLRECWMIQTEQDHLAPSVAYSLLESHFDQLTKREFKAIAKQLNVPLQTVVEAVNYFYTLAPAPVAFFDQEEIQYIEPDLFVQRKNDDYEVKYNFQNLPQLRFNTAYYQTFKEIEDLELHNFLKTKKQEFDAVLNSLKRREITLIQVSQVIIEKQYSFFKSKGHQLAPLTITEVAEECGMNPSTVSRAIQGKYFYTDFGTFELRKLFTTASIKSRGGETVSQYAVQQLIRELVDQESKHQPLSDQKLTDVLAEKGFPLARRTLTKYRQQLGILAAGQRRIK